MLYCTHYWVNPNGKSFKKPYSKGKVPKYPGLPKGRAEGRINKHLKKHFWEQTTEKYMAFGTDRQMFSVDLTCAKCGAHISQLPFQPTGDRPVYCSDCNRAFRQNRTGGGGGSFGGGMSRAPRQMFQVNLTCAGCGAAITELPFEPKGDRPVYCKAGMMARRKQMN